MADVQSVHNLLDRLRQPGKSNEEALKQLFWRELEYDRVNQSLSRQEWAEQAKSVLAADPVLFATGGEKFQIIYSRLKSDKLLKTEERPVVSRLLQDHPYALFVFSNQQQDRWHFLNVKYDDDVQRRRLFRRISVSPEDRLRTASERIGRIGLQDLPDAAPIVIQSRHDEAFDVEPVTKEFFQEYRRVFEQVEGAIRGISNDERKRLFTQRLFNRIMFIAFVAKKGWLKFGGDSDYLQAVWRDHQRDTIRGKNFYVDRLKALFFFGLNGGASETDVANINRGGQMRNVYGEVPYLNGGLFEEDEDDKDRHITVPDDAIDLIINERDGLFSRFNFTVTESTPLDVEVAVDPEMLGKIFEELVTGRHETGSYYTPKAVVSFMCREALKGYLESRALQESKQAIAAFVEKHQPGDLHNAEVILEALRSIKVCDPACGSGAYLLGMLHELVDLRECLFATKKLDARSAYERKLEIIQRSIYGVDIDAFAVNIARLRLWLSLAVDFQGQVPPPLPNLDFKIEIGDSLLAPDLQRAPQASFRQQHIGKYLELKKEFMTARGAHKGELRKHINVAKSELTVWAHGVSSVDGFDWTVEFAEVFLDGGFDITLANPPYVRADAQFRHLPDEGDRQTAISEWKEYRKALLSSDIYETAYEKWDLYLPFLERGYQLLAPAGSMTFIVSDAYNAAKYATKSHEFFVRNTRIDRIDFCSEIQLFDAGVKNTILHFTREHPRASHCPLRVRRWGDSASQFETNAELLKTFPQSELPTALFRLDGARAADVSEGFVPLWKICYISKGMVIHADEKEAHNLFKASDLISETKDATHPKKYIEGKDIVRWGVDKIRYLEYGTKRAPSLFSRKTFPEMYEVPEKCISMDLAGSDPRVAYDNRKLYHNHSAWSFVPWHALKGIRNRSIKKSAKYRSEVTSATVPPILREDLERLSKPFPVKYLVAIMNSSAAKDWLMNKRRNKMHIYPEDWKPLPVPVVTEEQRNEIASIIDSILELKTKQSTNKVQLDLLERDLDQSIRRLYGKSARASQSS